MIAEYSGEVAPEPRVSYSTTDHLGSPRVTTNERGVVVNRRDFRALGEEAVSVQRVGGGPGNGYEGTGSTRKDYTGYEKDAESGLEFAQARYYNSTHGRFTSVDPLTASATIRNPQSLNRYTYALNSPYKFTDPLGQRQLETTEGSWDLDIKRFGVSIGLSHLFSESRRFAFFSQHSFRLLLVRQLKPTVIMPP